MSKILRAAPTRTTLHRHVHHHIYSSEDDDEHGTHKKESASSKDEMLPRTPPKPQEPQQWTNTSRGTKLKSKRTAVLTPHVPTLVNQFEVGSDDGESDDDDGSSSTGNASMNSPASQRKRLSLSGASSGGGTRDSSSSNKNVGADHGGPSDDGGGDRDYFVLSNRSTRLLENMRKRIRERSSSKATVVEQQPTKPTTESEIASPKKLSRASRDGRISREESDTNRTDISVEGEEQRASVVNPIRLSQKIHRFRHAPPMSDARRERKPSAFLLDDDDVAQVANKKSWWDYEPGGSETLTPTFSQNPFNKPNNGNSHNDDPSNKSRHSTLDLAGSLQSLRSLSSSDEDARKRFEERYHPPNFQESVRRSTNDGVFNEEDDYFPVRSSNQSSSRSPIGSVVLSEDLEIALERIKNNFRQQQKKEIIQSKFSNSAESDEYMNSLLQRAQELLSNENSFASLVQSSQSSSSSSKSVSSSPAMSPTYSPDSSVVVPRVHREEKQRPEHRVNEKNHPTTASKLSLSCSTSTESVAKHNSDNSEQNAEDSTQPATTTTTMVSTSVQVDIVQELNPESNVTLSSEDTSTSTNLDHQQNTTCTTQSHDDVPEEKNTGTHRSTSPTTTTTQEKADHNTDDDDSDLSTEQLALYKQRIQEDKVCQLLLRKIQLLEVRLAELESHEKQ